MWRILDLVLFNTPNYKQTDKRETALLEIMEPNHAHMFWTFGKIKPLLDSIHSELAEMFGYTIP